MKGGDTMKSQARWNKIYQKKLRKQQEREQQKRLTAGKLISLQKHL